MTEEAWVVIGVNAAVVLFGSGAAYMRLKADGKTISELRKDLQNMKDKLWTKFDELDKREGRHYRKTVVALTALVAVSGNPNPAKTAGAIVREMVEGD